MIAIARQCRELGSKRSGTQRIPEPCYGVAEPALLRQVADHCIPRKRPRAAVWVEFQQRISGYDRQLGVFFLRFVRSDTLGARPQWNKRAQGNRR